MNYLLSIKRTGTSEFIDLGDDERAAREDFALLTCQFSLDGYIVSITGDRATAYTRDLTDVVTLYLLREGADDSALAMRDYEAMPPGNVPHDALVFGGTPIADTTGGMTPYVHPSSTSIDEVQQS